MPSSDPDKKLSLSVAFDVRSWNADLGGWVCDALRLPGANLDKMFSGGELIHPDSYRVERAIVRWMGKPPAPEKGEFHVILESDLSKMSARLHELEVRRILVPAIASVIVAIITGTATYLATRREPGSPSAAVVAQCRESLNRLTSLSILPGQSLDGLRGAISSHAEACRQTVRNGAD